MTSRQRILFVASLTPPLRHGTSGRRLPGFGKFRLRRTAVKSAIQAAENMIGITMPVQKIFPEQQKEIDRCDVTAQSGLRRCDATDRSDFFDWKRRA